MQELLVTSWKRFGHDRLYVNLPDGTSVGWADRTTGEITLVHPSYRDAVVDALARREPAIVQELPAREDLARDVPGRVGAAREGPAPESPAREGPARERPPRQGPTRDELRREGFGHDGRGLRLGHGLGGAGLRLDARGGERESEGESGGEGEDEGLGRLGKPSSPSSPSPSSAPALTPENDLASNRPGAALRSKLDEFGPGPAGLVVARLFHRRPEWDPWRRGLAGERRVGSELNRLSRHGWRVLHSIPLPREADIDHLLIGPGGVFTVHTRHHQDRTVWVDDDTVKIDDGNPQPHALKSRAEAKRAQVALEANCHFDVPVQSMVVYVGVARLDVVATQLQVRVYQERQVSALAPLSGVLDPRQVQTVYEVARDRRVWLDA